MFHLYFIKTAKKGYWCVFLPAQELIAAGDAHPYRQKILTSLAML